MSLIDGVVLDDELRRCANRVRDALGPAKVAVKVAVAPGWQSFADQLELERSEFAVVGATGDSPAQSPATRPVLLVGPPAFVLAHAATASAPFGFVTPDALTVKPWQRSSSWRDDTTLRLWEQGYSILAIDRVLVPTHAGALEFLVATARPTPATTFTGTTD